MNRRRAALGLVFLPALLVGGPTRSADDTKGDKGGTRYKMQVYLVLKGKPAFVNVEIEPDDEFMRAMGIKSEEEYKAVIQYQIQHDTPIFEALLRDKHPTVIVSRPKKLHEGGKQINLTHEPIGKRSPTYCMAPCNGAGSYCYIWVH